MMDHILQLLQWLVPTWGVGMLLGWLTSTRLRHARVNKEVHDTYKAMYEDVHGQLLQLSEETSELRTLLARLERAITKGSSCRIWATCPIRRELQRTEVEPDLRQLLRQRPRAHRDTPTARDHTSGDSDAPPALDLDPP